MRVTAANTPISGAQAIADQYLLDGIVRSVQLIPSGDVIDIVAFDDKTTNNPSSGDQAIQFQG